jgi:hypothetical protein
LGNALHYAIEKAYDGPWKIEVASRLFLKEFRRQIEDDEVFVTWPRMKKHEAEGIEMLELFAYAISQGKVPLESRKNEQEFRIPFEEEIVIVGKIDRIDEENGEYIVTDYKSGKKKPDAWFLRHDLQFTCYAWACQVLYGKLPKKLVWHNLRTGDLLETERTQRDVDELQVMMHNALEMNRKGIRYRVYHQQVCGWCEFQGEVCDDRELEDELVRQREALLAGDNTYTIPTTSPTLLPSS